MFKLLVVILSALAVTANDGSSLQYRGNMKHPKLADHCYFPEHDLSIPVKESVYPTNLKNSCITVLCREDFVLEIRYCGNENLYPNATCTIESDYKQPFPSCCPKRVCH